MDQLASPSSRSSTENESSEGSDSEQDSVDNNNTSSDDDSDTGSINQNLSSKQLLIKKRAKEMSDNDSTWDNGDPDAGSNSGSVCDWLCEQCIAIIPGNDIILELKKCQHSGGTCKKFVHHICAVTWGAKHGVEDVGNLCQKHAPGYNIKKTTTSTLSTKQNTSSASAVKKNQAQERKKAISDDMQANKKNQNELSPP
jgi:hypothetical protein